MADFYGRMTATASRLLDRFQQGDVYYVPLLAGANAWDPKTVGTPVKLKATAKGVSEKYVSDLIMSSDIEVTCGVMQTVWADEYTWDDLIAWSDTGAPVIPANSALVTIDGRELQIVKVMRIPAAGEPIVFKIFCRG